MPSAHPGEPAQHLQIAGLYSFEVSRSAEAAGGRMTIRGPTPPDEGIRRLRQHIREVGKGQLPPDKPSLLVIDCNPCWPSVSMEEPDSVVRDLQEYICEHENRVAVVLVSEHVGVVEQGYINDEQSMVFDRTLDPLRNERIIVIMNPYSPHKTALSLLPRILPGAACSVAGDRPSEGGE
jgi:hypothetical protein